MSATIRVDAAMDVVFRVLADPGQHAAIDGTGWVCGSLDSGPLTAAGQVFRMTMYHREHPDWGYQTANRVLVLERPTAISWETGYYAGDGSLRFGGWTWRYDLAPAGPSSTEVTLSYDWSAVRDPSVSTSSSSRPSRQLARPPGRTGYLLTSCPRLGQPALEPGPATLCQSHGDEFRAVRQSVRKTSQCDFRRTA